MYKKFEKLLEEKGVTPYRVHKETGISTATLSDWKNGKSEPKRDKIEKICEYFNVPISYFYGEDKENEDVYYINDDAREMAQFMFENPEYKILFDASRKVKKEDIQFAKEMIDRMSNK